MKFKIVYVRSGPERTVRSATVADAARIKKVDDGVEVAAIALHPNVVEVLQANGVHYVIAPNEERPVDGNDLRTIAEGIRDQCERLLKEHDQGAEDSP